VSPSDSTCLVMSAYALSFPLLAVITALTTFYIKISYLNVGIIL